MRGVTKLMKFSRVATLNVQVHTLTGSLRFREISVLFEPLVLCRVPKVSASEGSLGTHDPPIGVPRYPIVLPDSIGSPK